MWSVLLVMAWGAEWWSVKRKWDVSRGLTAAGCGFGEVEWTFPWQHESMQHHPSASYALYYFGESLNTVSTATIDNCQIDLLHFTLIAGRESTNPSTQPTPECLRQPQKFQALHWYAMSY
jgi:hypothetical protein